MSKSHSQIGLFALIGTGTAAMLGTAVVVAEMTTTRSTERYERPGLIAAAEAQQSQVAAPAEADESQGVAVAPADAETAPSAAADSVAVGADGFAEAPAPSRDGGFNLGREALPEEVAAWDIDVRPDGQGLPGGSGDVWTGEEIYIAQCAGCHGDFGEAVGRWPQLAGGFGTLDSEDPVKTVGSYWPYLSTVVDYVHRAMPFGNAQSLSPDEVYALTAYILYLNDVVGDDFVLSDESFAEVEMPNAGGFIDDDRDATELVHFTAEPCMEACKEAVEITMRAAVLDVTPNDGSEIAEVVGAAIEEPQMAEAVSGTNTTEAEAAAAEVVEEGSVDAESQATPVEDALTADEEAAAPEADEAGDLDIALVEAGEGVFRRCGACHQVGEGAVNRSGPVLNGVVGRTMGTFPDFRYSQTLVEAGEAGRSWSVEELSSFLADPRGHLPGNKMSFQGLRSEEEIAAVIEFLRAHTAHTE